jgi:hypothetical protein
VLFLVCSGLDRGFFAGKITLMTIDFYISAHDTPPPSRHKTGSEPRGRAMGTCAEVRAALTALAPGIDWSDPTWGWLHDGDAATQFVVGPEDPCLSVGVFTRFTGPWSGRFFAALRQARPDWYVMDAFYGEWDHRLQPCHAGVIESLALHCGTANVGAVTAHGVRRCPNSRRS